MSESSESSDQETVSDDLKTLEAQEATPEYSITRLIMLARLLTENQRFMVTDQQSVEALLNIGPSPSCDANKGDYVDLLEQLKPSDGSPPTYAGDDPIGNIVMVLRQLGSCQNTTDRSLLSKIGDFFMRRDGGKMLRQLLLLSKVVIEILCLWCVFNDNLLLDQTASSLQSLGASALQARGLANADTSVLPPSVASQISAVRQMWKGDVSKDEADFGVGWHNKAPVLLVFVPQALEASMQALEATGSLPPQDPVPDDPSIEQAKEQVAGPPPPGSPEEQALQGTSTGSDKTKQLASHELRQFVEGYLGSGQVEPLTK